MKKNLFILLFSLLLVFVCVSCDNGNDTHDHVDTNEDGKCDVCEIELNHVDKNDDGKCDICDTKVRLDTPVVTVDEEGNATWAAIDGAVSYVYCVGTKEMATSKTTYKLNDGETIKVKALGQAPMKESKYSEEVTYTAPITVVYGIPENAEGFYMRDADVIQDGDTRYIVFTTNKTKATEDSVIAIMTGVKDEKGYVYSEAKVILEASETGWDQYLGSASLTKGVFELNGETYNYLLAYQGSSNSDNKANQIGFAVSKTIDGEYVKLEGPQITYDAAVYGANMVGAYAPSVVNYDKVSCVRLFYTLADQYGHYAYFADFDLSDLSNITYESAMITNAGAIQGGDAVTMFPNADFAYDSVNNVFYAVKDVSPSPALKPSFADEWEICHIAEDELYTTDQGEGWVSDLYQDYLDLECERAYSACIVSDMYGHMLSGDMVIIFNDCALGNEYIYTQHFVEYICK